MLLTVELGRRFSETFDAAVGGMLDRRYGRSDEALVPGYSGGMTNGGYGRSDEAPVPGYSGRVFDLQGQTVYARLAYALRTRWRVV